MSVKALETSESPADSSGLKALGRRATALVTATSFLLSSLAGSLSPAYAQQIVDPTAPIQFQPGITSSGNGTPTVNIVRPSNGGVSHNKFRQYDIDTRGVILNNSGLGGTSVIGGAVAPNPNLAGGSAARVIVNEVTGTKRSNLNGATEVFGAKADVIVANPNGVDCMGCGFINTGTATLTTGVPIVDYNAGTVGFDTRKGDITISGAGVSTPAGQKPDDIRIIGKSIKVDGLVDAENKIQLSAGSTRTDGTSGVSTAIAGDPGGAGIVSGALGVIRAGSIEVLSTDVDTGVVLSGNLQALGTLNATGAFVPGSLSIVSAGNASIMSGEAAGNVTVTAAQALQIARDLSAMGEIAITANDISLLGTAGLHAGQGLKIIANRDIVSGAVMKAGAALSVKAGRDESLSGLIASAKDVDLRAGRNLATDTSTIVAPTLRLNGGNVSSTATWFSPSVSGSIDGVNVELGKDTVIDPTKPFAVTAAQQLTIGTALDMAKFPNLSLAFRDLAISQTGGLAWSKPELVANQLINAGVLTSAGQLVINAQYLQNETTGVIKAGTLAVSTGGDLTNLGKILSETTLSLVAEGRLTNNGVIGANDSLVLDAVSYVADSPAAELVASNVRLILDQGLTNAGSIQALGTATITAGGNVNNSGDIRSNANLTLVAADIVNSDKDALIGSNANLSIRGRTVTNTLGALQANGSFELIATNGLTNSGLVYAGSAANLAVVGLSNAATGKIFVGKLDVDLGNRDLTNLGQIVSSGTLNVLKGNAVINDGAIQAKTALHLEAVSYQVNSAAAELVAQNADLILSGVLTNSGLIAASQALKLQVGGDLTNASSGEIVANLLEAQIGHDLKNLGSILSETALKATVAGLLSNGGSIRADGDLNLVLTDLVNSGTNALIASNGNATITASNTIANSGGTILSSKALSASAAGDVANSGLFQATDSLAILAHSLDNQQAGRIFAGSVVETANGRVPVGLLTVNLTGSLGNAGQIVSANQATISAAGIAANTGSIEAGGDLRLQAYSYQPGSASARLAARNLDLILGSSFTNDGLLSVAGRLGLDINGDLVNSATGRIEASVIEAKVAANLTNLGQILSSGAMKIVVGGLLANESRIHAGTDLQVEAHDLVNLGANAAIKSNGSMFLDINGNLENSLGRIFAGGDMAIEVLAVLTNASGRIETGDDMQITAATLLNTALDGTDGGTVDFHELGPMSVLYATQRTSGPARYWGTMSAARDEYSGVISLRLPGVIRAGGSMELIGGVLHNQEGRILAVEDMSIDMSRIINDTVSHTVDHYRHEWQGDRLFMDNGDGRFHAPIIGGDPNWVVRPYAPNVFKNPFLATLSEDGDRMIVISKGKSPVTITYQGKSEYEDGVIHEGSVEIIEYADAAQLVDLAALGIDPNNVPDVIMIGNRTADINSSPYGDHQQTLVGTAAITLGSVIKAGGALMINADQTTNLGTMAGSLVVIEGGELANGLGSVGGVDGSGFGNYAGTTIGALNGNGGSVITTGGGNTGVANFVLDDVAVPVLDLGAFNSRNLVSVDPNNFGNLVAFTGSLEAARMLESVGKITGTTLSFYSDPVAEAKALADAAQKAAGSHLIIDPSLSLEEQREQLYKNAAEFAAATGAQYGVALTEAQRAALDKPIVWYETRIIDGKSVLVPRLYLPSSDELLRGSRGAGLIAADDLLIDLDGKLNNGGAIVASGLASISASSIINQRLIDMDERDRALVAGRGDSGVISAGTLLMVTDRDLVNYGGTIVSSDVMDLRIGGSLINETQRYTRDVDFQDGCIGKACGTTRVDYNTATIAAGRDLTIIADQDIINRGGDLGAVTDMLLAAGRNIEFETLKDSFVAEDYKQTGFLSGIKVLRNEITTSQASAQSLLGSVSMFAGYGVCDGGTLCSEGKAPGDAILNGALVSAYDTLSIDATGQIDMGVVSKEVDNKYSEWGITGLTFTSVKQKWNDIDTSVTQLSGYDVILNAKGPITGTGVKISAVNDLLMKTDDSIKLEASQDALYFTEKGFSIGLTFPGSAGIDAALRGASGSEILSGLAGINPLTSTLARLANADNGLAAGLAVVDLATGGLGAFFNAGQSVRGPSLTSPIAKMLDPLGQFRNQLTGEITAGSIASTVGISISSWQKDQRWTESQVSELTAGGDIVMQAGLDVLLTEGTKMVAGDDVSLDAGRDIVMSALLDYAKDKSSNFGLQLSLGSIGFSMGKSEGYDEKLTNASITAGGNVSLVSGRDVALLGGNIAGQNVSLDVGRDLTVLSPQAQGWREGFTFGLTVGLDLTSFGISGSMEEGEKAWSSGSSIVAAEDVAIKVGEDTTLVGALLQATDGDISLETGTLTAVDLKDKDQYTNIGGSLGFNGGGLSSFGFSYENNDKQGETRTTLDAGGALNVTIHDADKDGVADTEADKAAAEQQLTAINQDASTWQEVTKDSHTELSGEINVENLGNFSRNLQYALQYQQAQNAAVPDWIASEGAQAVDQYREAILGGATPEEAEQLMKTPRFQAMLAERKSFDAMKQGPVSNDDLLKSIMLIAGGEELYRDPATGALMVKTVCGVNGPCGVEVSKLKNLEREDIEKFILPRLEAAEAAGLRDALECAIAVAYVSDDNSYLGLLQQSGKYDAAELATYINVVEKIKNQGHLANILPGAADDDIDVFMALTDIVVDLESGKPGADQAAVRLVQEILAGNGTVNSVVAASIVNAFEKMGFTQTAAATSAIFEEAWSQYEAALERAKNDPNSPEAKAFQEGVLFELVMSTMTSGRGGLVKVVGPKGPVLIDRSKISTANLNQSAVPRNPQEYAVWRMVLANSSAGTKLDGKNSDPRFYYGEGWQKMEYKTYTSDGQPIVIHYQRNQINGDVYDMKIVSAPLTSLQPYPVFPSLPQ